MTWKKRPFGTLKGGPDSAPTSVSSELDFSRPSDDANPASPSAPSGSDSSSSSRPSRVLRSRRKCRSAGPSASGSVSPAFPSGDSAGSWSPGHSSAGPGPSPLREQFSPSIDTSYPTLSQDNSPTRQHPSPLRQQIPPIHQDPIRQDTIVQPQYHCPDSQNPVAQLYQSPLNQPQRHGRFHPYHVANRAPAAPPQVQEPPGVPWFGASSASVTQGK